jgi:hypothetical protein
MSSYLQISFKRQLTVTDKAMGINITSLSPILSLVLFCERFIFAKGEVEMERLVKAVAAAVVLFFVVLGLVVGSRMDQTTIALLGGTTIGLLIATPCSAIATYLAIRNRDEQGYGQSHHYSQPPQSPPHYWVVQPSPNMPRHNHITTLCLQFRPLKPLPCHPDASFI